MVFWFKKNNNTGSAILIVVFLMSVLSICCMIFWQKSILFYNISIKRLEYEQKYRAASCGLEYAISVCAKNQDDQNSYFMETEEFEISDNIKYKCKIYINKNGEKVLNLRSVLVNLEDEKVFEVSCDALKARSFNTEEIKNKNLKKLIINNWKVCDK